MEDETPASFLLGQCSGAFAVKLPGGNTEISYQNSNPGGDDGILAAFEHPNVYLPSPDLPVPYILIFGTKLPVTNISDN